MVSGVEKFKEALGVFADNYVVIGGTACDVVLSEYAVRPRATVDIDLIVVVENLSRDFVDALWAFVRDGGYHIGKRQRRDGESAYALYRFNNPADARFPWQIELLSRHSELLGEPSGFHVEPIPVEEEQYSLSAIIMDDELYNFTIGHSRVIGGLRVADPLALICLKATAYMNLLRDKSEGRHVNDKDLAKHRTDVARLLSAETYRSVGAASGIRKTIAAFSAEMRRGSMQSLSGALRLPEAAISGLLDDLDGYFLEEGL